MLTIYFEDTPRLWAAHFDPEGPIGRGKTKLEAVEELLWHDEPSIVKRLAEEVLELVQREDEAKEITKRYAAYISPEEHALALSKDSRTKPAWYTEELEEILKLLADALGVRHYDADGLLKAAQERVAYAGALTEAARELEQVVSKVNRYRDDGRHADVAAALVKVRTVLLTGQQKSDSPQLISTPEGIVFEKRDGPPDGAPCATDSLPAGQEPDAYDEWIKTPEGNMALVITSRCDTYAQADKVLKAAFNAGSKRPAVNSSEPKA